MRHISRRFSGYAFLYVAIASIATQTAIGLTMVGVYLIPDYLNGTLGIFLSKLIIFLPPLILVAVRKYPLARVLRLHTFSAKYAGYATGIGICLFLFVHSFNLLLSTPIALILNQPYTLFGDFSPSLWPYILTSCLVPALLEVAVYQGAVQSGLHDVKPLKACLLVGLLYGLVTVGSYAVMGSALWSIIGAALIGFTLSYIALQSGSILPSMIAAFVYYLFNCGNFENMFYKYCLLPLGVSELAAAIGLLILSGGIGVLLIIRMPRSRDTGRPLRLPRLPSFEEFRLKLTQPYIPAPKAEAPEAPHKETSPPAAPEAAEPLQEVHDAGDTAKNKNVGFIIGGVLLAALSLASLIYGIMMIVTQTEYIIP
jgi:membrane protease YdiL (CAAX protease family)